jgi:hypothetical protein
LHTALRALEARAYFHRRFLEYGAMLVLLVPYAAFSFYVPIKNTRDFVAVVDKVFAQPLPANSVVLVCSDARGEGAFVSEMAMRGPRPSYFVVRSRKFLSRQTLMGQHYVSLFKNEPEVIAALDRVPISMVVLDDSVVQEGGKDGLLMAKLPQGDPERWQLMHTVYKEAGGQIRIYKLKGSDKKKSIRLSIDMHYTLGRSIGTQ